MNSDTLSIIESKKPPNELTLLVNRAIAPSHPSMMPVKNTKIENNNRLRKKTIEINPSNEIVTMMIVAKLGVTLILINPLAMIFTTGLNMNLNRYFEGIFIEQLLLKNILLYN